MPTLHGGQISRSIRSPERPSRPFAGRERPRLGLAGAGTDEEVARRRVSRCPRACSPTAMRGHSTPRELVFSWLVEPEKWDRVPFLLGANETLRGDLLHLPLTDGEGNRLKYVSPYQFRHALEHSANTRAAASTRLATARRKRKRRGSPPAWRRRRTSSSYGAAGRGRSSS